MTNKRDQWAHDLVAKWPYNPQPSDNLQQVSTAQVGAAPNNAEVAPSVAQATPEGADLPPLPRAYGYLTGCNLDMEHSLEAAQAVCDHDNAAEMAIREHDPSYADPDWQPAKPEPLFDADQMRDYARAALAAQQNSASNSSNNSATTAAEPVYQEHIAFSTWEDVTKERVEQMKADEEDWYRILYTAAPLPEAGELREAADCLYKAIVNFDGPAGPVPINPESAMVRALGSALYRAAPPQQVDTGGLPG
jgi:hypothetical protein